MADKEILKKLASHDKRLSNIEKRMATKTEIKEFRISVISSLNGHDQKFEQLVTKDDMVLYRDEILNGLDRQMVVLQRLDQERVVATHRIDRLEAHVGLNQS